MKNFSIFSLLCTSIAILLASPLFAASLNTESNLNTTSSLVDTAPTTTILAPQTKFTPAIDDLPLMPNLNPVPQEDVIFVTQHAGRIAESTAQGPVDIDDVYKFYHSSLPHLGWKIVDARTYLRDGERLRIDAHADGKVTTVRFSVKPN